MTATNTDGAALMTDRYPASDDAELLEADMVMKGGITSGVVYPWAVCELAKRYRFRNLGGTSAGGIAAAFAAVAETNRDGRGFNVLAELPGKLGNVLGDLFQPSPRTRQLHDVLLAAIHPERKGARKGAGVYLAALWAGRVGFVLGTLTLLVPLTWIVLLAWGVPHDGGDWWSVLGRGGWLAVILAMLIGGSLGAVASLVLGGLRGLQANGYGVCRGSAGADWPVGAPEKGIEPFTDWMHAELNRCAGKPRSHVLTLGDLWGDEAVARYWEVRGTRRRGRPGIGDALAAIEPDVRLEMMTTNVTHCRPKRLPFESDDHLFCREEMSAYLPPPVVAHLVARGRAALGDEDVPWTCPSHPAVELLHLPEPPDFPVIMTVRLTLSFPGLISAVPLYSVDRSLKAHRPVRCWFSDGGVSSNFPIHFFDALWPRRPTFGISLAPYHDEHKDKDVYLPDAGSVRVPRVRKTESFVGFVTALLDTLQNWSDEGQSVLPGYRDRIVDIHHNDAEGGMNLTMKDETITSLSRRGLQAAQALLGEFDFDAHRWIRYRTAMGQLDRSLTGLVQRWDGPLPGGLGGYRNFVSEYGPTTGHYDVSRTWVEGAVARTDTLLTFAGRRTNGVLVEVSPDFVAASPRPRPDLRTAPRF